MVGLEFVHGDEAVREADDLARVLAEAQYAVVRPTPNAVRVALEKPEDSVELAELVVRWLTQRQVTCRIKVSGTGHRKGEEGTVHPAGLRIDWGRRTIASLIQQAALFKSKYVDESQLLQRRTII